METIPLSKTQGLICLSHDDARRHACVSLLELGNNSTTLWQWSDLSQRLGINTKQQEAQEL